MFPDKEEPKINPPLHPEAILPKPKPDLPSPILVRKVKEELKPNPLDLLPILRDFLPRAVVREIIIDPPPEPEPRPDTPTSAEILAALDALVEANAADSAGHEKIMAGVSELLSHAEWKDK